MTFSSLFTPVVDLDVLSGPRSINTTCTLNRSDPQRGPETIVNTSAKKNQILRFPTFVQNDQFIIAAYFSESIGAAYIVQNLTGRPEKW
jgi:hypothetical protein